MKNTTLTLCFLFWVTVVFSQLPSWEKAGRIASFNNAIECMITDGSYIYVGTSKDTLAQNGVFRSDLSGTNFSLVGLEDESIVALASGYGKVYAGTENGNIYLSDDQGNSWSKITNHSEFSKIYAIGVDDQFIITGAISATTGNSGIFISYDAGQTWNGPYMNSNLASMFLFHGDDIYAVIQSKMYKSSDGMTWTQFSIGNGVYDISTLAIFDNILYAGTGSGLYKTPLEAFSWTSTGLMAPTITSVTKSGSTVIALADQLYASYNGGNFWQIPPTSYDIKYGVSLIQLNGKIVAASGDGVFTSNDNGNSWVNEMSGFKDSPVMSMALNGNDIVIGTYHNGLFISKNNGLTWIKSNTGISGDNYAYASVSALACSGGNLIASVGPYNSFRSADNGLNWNYISFPFFSNFNEIKAPYGSMVYAANDITFFQSSNNGVSWAQNFNLNFTAVTSVDAVEGKLFLGLSNNTVLFSNNEGQTFAEIPLGEPSYNRITALLIKDNYLYAGDATGVHRININNFTDIEFSNIGARVNDLIAYDNYVLAATSGAGMLVSNDSGEQWTAVNTGLGDLNLFQLLIKDGTALAASGNGLWKYTIPANLGIPEKACNQLVVYPNPASDCINIKINDPSHINKAKIALINCNGNIMSEFVVTDLKSTLSLNNMAGGIYTLRLISDQSTNVVKLIVK